MARYSFRLPDIGEGIAEAEIAPHVAQWDRDHHFPIDVVHKMGDLGLFGLTAPEEYGGAGGDFTSLCVAIEEVGRVDQALGVTIDALYDTMAMRIPENGPTARQAGTSDPARRA